MQRVRKSPQRARASSGVAPDRMHPPPSARWSAAPSATGITSGLRRIAVPLEQEQPAGAAGVWPHGLKIGRGIAAQPHLGPQRPSKEGTRKLGSAGGEHFQCGAGRPRSQAGRHVASSTEAVRLRLRRGGRISHFEMRGQTRPRARLWFIRPGLVPDLDAYLWRSPIHSARLSRTSSRCSGLWFPSPFWHYRRALTRHAPDNGTGIHIGSAQPESWLGLTATSARWFSDGFVPAQRWRLCRPRLVQPGYRTGVSRCDDCAG